MSPRFRSQKPHSILNKSYWNLDLVKATSFEILFYSSFYGPTIWHSGLY